MGGRRIAGWNWSRDDFLTGAATTGLCAPAKSTFITESRIRGRNMSTQRKSMRRSAGFLALALMAGPMSWPADTTVIKSRGGSCQVTVAAGWTPGELGGAAESPDKQLSLAISSPKMVDSFAELKQTAKSVYKQSKVTKDTGSEFQMEGESITGQPDVYRAIPIGASKFCIVEVTYKTGSPDGARAIALTLRGAK
jgi:hypothetical protein